MGGGFLWIDRTGSAGATESPRGPGPLQLVGLRSKRWSRGVDRGGKLVSDLNPTFTPDGRRVAFARSFCQSEDGDCTSAGIWEARVASGKTTLLLSDGSCPSWSADGKRLLFLDAAGALRLTEPGSAQSTVLLEKAGSGPFRGPCSLGGVAPRWSADSNYIAFDSFDDGQITLNVVPVSDPGQLRTFRQIGNVVQYAWSPKSDKLLAISLSKRSLPCSLWLLDARNGSTRSLHRCTS